MPDYNILIWIILSLLGVAGGTGWLGSLQSRMTRLGEIQAKHGERIASLESCTEGIADRLDRIEHKLDKLLNSR
jgi:hypothetical protein